MTAEDELVDYGSSGDDEPEGETQRKTEQAAPLSNDGDRGDGKALRPGHRNEPRDEHRDEHRDERGDRVDPKDLGYPEHGGTGRREGGEWTGRGEMRSQRRGDGRDYHRDHRRYRDEDDRRYRSHRDGRGSTHGPNWNRDRRDRHRDDVRNHGHPPPPPHSQFPPPDEMMAMMMEQQQHLMMAAMSQFVGMGRGRGRGRHTGGRGGHQGRSRESFTFKRKNREETPGELDETNNERDRNDENVRKEQKLEEKGVLEGGRARVEQKLGETRSGASDMESRLKLMEEKRKRIEYLERLAEKKKANA